MDSQVQETFPEDVNEAIDGLLWLGYLEDTVTFCGHEFVIRTLRGDEELMAALIMKEYIETLGQAKAHIWSLVALALVAIDGDPDFCPQATPNKKDYARARFQYCTSNWYWPVALRLYGAYTALLDRQEKAMEGLEDFWKGNLMPFTPGPGSSTDKASSPPLEEDIRDFLDPDPSAPSSSES